ncbi:MAG: APC family permease [Chloroflexi bacterium]|nr:APC family permease [Chloroflexota bacterium]
MFISKQERQETNRKLPKLMFEGLLLGGTGLGVLALIFEIAADAFSVAAYQTLLAINGASGVHEIAILAFIILSVMLFFGVVPAYQAAAYLRPNTGGSGPLVESIGPSWLRNASWIGTSLFFIDAVLTIIISSISAADVTMLLAPELVEYRIVLAEIYAFFIMVVLVSLGPRKAVPLFLLGGGLFTVFTLGALSFVTFNAITQPELAALTPGIVERLEMTGVAEHITETLQVTSVAVFLQLLMRSMSSAMLGFSGYEMIPASGKHAAKPKWKVINTALTLAAIFLIGTGVMQLFAAFQWDIPATEGYSTLLIQYEIVFGETAVLQIAGLLLAVILLLAQGGGYVGGAAVASTASRLGRMPRFFQDDRIGIAVIWGIAAVLIPIIRQVVVVEAYYAFGFVSAFLITGATVYFVRDDVLVGAGIEIGSKEAKSLRFAGFRGMVASAIMMAILVTQKTEALPAILVATIALTAFQLIIYYGGTQRKSVETSDFVFVAGGELPKELQGATKHVTYPSGIERAYDEARQRGIVEVVNEMIHEGAFVKFNVEPARIRRLICYTHGINPEQWKVGLNGEHETLPEPTLELQEIFQAAHAQREGILATIEHYSHVGIFAFIDKFHRNWVNERRSPQDVQRAMIRLLFTNNTFAKVWGEWEAYQHEILPEEIWQFSRERYHWAKDQWPNLSDRVTTVWTLQDLNLLEEMDTEKILIALGEQEYVKP